MDDGDADVNDGDANGEMPGWGGDGTAVTRMMTMMTMTKR
jgi:hypothetical protein